jgi:glycosyltransferase involved in cell wall biosynthesis
MKVIALLPVKNEEWILPTYISSMKNFVDQIIVIDDGSTDRSRRILEDAGCLVVPNEKRIESGWPEFDIREKLLELGRENGGTHFVCLDADEILTSTLKENFRSTVSSMVPGQKIFLKWITVWKSNKEYADNQDYQKLFKDFVFCDDGISHHKYAFLGVGRTPSPLEEISPFIVQESEGGVIHFQYAAWERNQCKQAWYRCSELIKGDRSSKRINLTYSHTLGTNKQSVRPVNKEWYDDIILPDIKNGITDMWQYEQIISWFDKHGIEFFEPLQIWHIPELRTEFIKRTGHDPKFKVFHPIIVFLNKIKNRIRNSLHI